MATVPPGEVAQDPPVKSELKVKGLPAGWRREVVVRKNGQSAGKTDVYYYSPCGKKFRSKPQIARFLGDSADLTVFDFSRAGTPGDGSSRRGARDRRRHTDASKHAPPPFRPLTINPLRESGPVRRTCGVIKLPVTCFAPPSDEDVKKSTIQMETSMATEPAPAPQPGQPGIQQPEQPGTTQQPGIQQPEQPGTQQLKQLTNSLLTAPGGVESTAATVSGIPTENKQGVVEQPKPTPPTQNPPVSSSTSAVMLPLLWENSLKGVKAHNHETHTEIDITPKLRNGLNHSSTAGKDTLGVTEKSLLAGGGSLDAKPQLLGALLAAKPAQNLMKSQALGLSSAAVVPSLLAHGKKVGGGQGAGPVVVTSLKNVQENGSLANVNKQNNVSNIVLTFPSVASANAFKAKQAAAGGVITVAGAQRQGVKPNTSGGATISLAPAVASSNSTTAFGLGSGNFHVSELELKRQEEKVKQLRQQLMAAQSTV